MLGFVTSTQPTRSAIALKPTYLDKALIGESLKAIAIAIWICPTRQLENMPR
ncbi:MULTISPECIES: hypothetical protein [Pseudanabaena]|uniref:Uncharacterized protein n=1 Tax=Pseudanabaena catenata USMAC16 TaxID=1855837 RepID=A0A9X4M616_9CYAN|nr:MULTISPECIES: hypothetical protein [Pseudanabaena]MDG3493519.1 hypothetical protein [Pseudanabaena catenata USMAC16]